MSVPRIAFKHSLRKAYDYIDGITSDFWSTIPVNVTVNVSANQQSLAFGTLTVDGTLIVSGEFRVTDWPV